MKVVAINGSPRKGGNTEVLLKRVCTHLEKRGIEMEIIKIGGELLALLPGPEPRQRGEILGADTLFLV